MSTKCIITQEILNSFIEIDICCISDAMDRLGLSCGLEGIKPINGGKSICGKAFTVSYIPCGINKGTVGDFLDDVSPGNIIVIDNRGRMDCTVWGDLMTIRATKMKLGGTVIDGVCRDIPVIKDLKYPIFTRGNYMVTGKDRVEVNAINIPVSISGIKVTPGDIVRGDDNGVIIIPQGKAQIILEVAKEIAEKEAFIEQAVRNGHTLKEAREKVSYHHLQTHKG